MAKQTFTTGQVLTAAQMTSLQQTAMLGGAASAKTASYTLVAADAGTAISMSNAGATTITVNTGLFAAGDTVHITNLGAGVSTITAGTATVNSSASLALAQYESGFLDFTSTSAAIFVKGAGAAPAASGGMTLLSTTTLSGTSTTISSISGSYTNLQIIVKGVNQSTGGGLIINPNSNSGLCTWWMQDGSAGGGGSGSTTPTYLPLTGNQSDLAATQTDNAFCCIIYDYASAASIKNFGVQSRFRKNATPTYAGVGAGGGIATSSAISSIQITTTGGSATHSAGTVEIYGVK
jgi:hypothetical protein